MKGLLIFILGITVGALGYRFMQERTPEPAAVTKALPQPEAVEPTPLKEKVARVAQGMGEIARDTGAVVGEKLRAWKLTPDDLREDLKRGGAVVRTKAREAGAGLGDARILAMVKAKYVLDRDLSARSIDVDVKGGEVTLHGEVTSALLLGHAIALALDTDGVVSVTSRLIVSSP
ncbi:MAG: BON domain-containing protein [Opitutaceae bacterium]